VSLFYKKNNRPLNASRADPGDIRREGETLILPMNQHKSAII
jgi:hypothetical protein